MEMEMDRQLFVLGPEIWASIDKEEIKATGRSMTDAGIYNYPYDEFDISAYGKTKDLMVWVFSETKYHPEIWNSLKKDERPLSFHFRYYGFNKNKFKYSMRVNLGGEYVFLPNNSEELLSGFPNLTRHEAYSLNNRAADAMLETLLVMLATKNVEKEILHKPKRYKDPESKGGIKQIRNKEYQYITTIKIGKITETLRSSVTSRGPIRAHLRRGHIRNQRFGEGFKEIKQVFIHPVFVNADERWIENQRKEYRVKM